MVRMASGDNTPAWRKPLAIALLLLGSVLLVVAFRVFVAGLAAVQAQMFLDDWVETRNVPPARAWQVADSAAERAIAWYPGDNGHYLGLRGRVDQWHDLRAPYGAESAQEYRERAIGFYRQAIETRPLWPFGYNELAYAKLRNLDFDDEFHQALASSGRLAPGRIPIHAVRVEIGLIAWPQLDTAEREGVWRSLETVLAFDPRQAKPLLELAQRARLDAELCLSLDPQLLQRRNWCQG